MKIQSGSGFNLTVASLKNGQAEADDSLVVGSGLAETGSLEGHKPRKNLIEGNFYKSNSERSRYIQGAMIGLQVQNEFKNKMSGIVEQYKLQADAAGTYAERSLTGRKAAAAMEDMVDGEVSNKAAERMEKDREEDEAKAAERQEEKAAEKAKGQSGDASEASGAEVSEAKDAERTQAAADQTAEGDATVSALDLNI